MAKNKLTVIDAVPVRHWGRLASALVAGAIVAMIVNALITNPNWHWAIVWENLFRTEVLQAVGWTLALTVGAMVVGIILAVTMAVMRRNFLPIIDNPPRFG